MWFLWPCVTWTRDFVAGTHCTCDSPFTNVLLALPVPRCWRARIVSSQDSILRLLHRDQRRHFCFCHNSANLFLRPSLLYASCLRSNSGLPLKTLLSTLPSHLMTPFPFHLKTFTTIYLPDPFGGFVILARMLITNIYSSPPDSEETTVRFPGAFSGKICS